MNTDNEATVLLDEMIEKFGPEAGRDVAVARLALRVQMDKFRRQMTYTSTTLGDQVYMRIEEPR